MGKKRRQHDTNVDGSEESTESGEGCNKGPKCPHFAKAVNTIKLRKAVDKKMNIACLDCKKNGDNITDNDDEFSNESPELWICLQCGHVACGRGQKGHAKKHHETPRSDTHCIVMDTHRWSIWCYSCDDVVIRNDENKVQLTDITEMFKKWIKRNTPIQLKPHILLCQNETLTLDNEKKILNDLPKVGGLANLGNTCFFNAVLQCLAQTPYLIKVLDDLQVPDQKFVLPGGKFKGTDNEEIDLPPIEGILERNVSFTPVLRKTLTEMQNSDGQIYRPTELLNSLKKKTMQCTDGGQHDSHELLRHLLELVRNEDVRRYHTVILKKLDLNDKKKRQGADDTLKSHLKFYGNQASAKFLGPERVFRGELVSTLQCLECNHTSSRTEPFLDISLPVLVDKSLPPIPKRKNSNFENAVDTTSNNVSNTPSKYELKKAHKANKRKHRMNKFKNRENSNLLTSNANHVSEEKKENIIESEESDADIEDNIENEDVSITDTGESRYSSEKPSAVTSPISLTELPSTDQNVNNLHLNVPPVEDLPSYSCDFTQFINENDNNCNYSQTPTDIQMLDSMENKKNGTELSLSTSLVVHSDFTSPEGLTISPLSSPLTSKDSPTSPISSAVDGDDNEKAGKLFLGLDSTEKHELNDNDSPKKGSIDLEDENVSNDKESSATKKLTNGVNDVTSNITKLSLSSPCESPTGYATKEGECSIQLCLNQFTALELMNANNKVGCTACTERENKGKKEEVKLVCTDSTKQYLISRVPAVLILHLKRFQVQKFNFRKVGKHVSFPMLLDLAPVSKDYTKPRIYALYGVVEHIGNLYGGHYVAYVKSRAPLKPNDPRWSFLPTKDGFESKNTSSESNSEVESDETPDFKNPKVESPPGKWYHVSDARVHEVDEKVVLNSEAYLLFYERIL